jgi:DsbC/DsbD-like thiol-disulfide interchange protein
MARLAAGIVVVSLLAATVSAQRPQDLVRWTARAPDARVQPGGTATLTIVAEIADGWHVYALTQPQNGLQPLTIATSRAQGFEVRAAAIDAPLPAIATDPATKLETQSYAGSVTLHVPLNVPRRAAKGAHTVPVEITYQTCSDSICLRPHTETLSVSLTVGTGTRK